MRVTKITAKNYRTLENITLTFAQDYCTLSGRNNAGKSCVVRLLMNLMQNVSARPWYPEELRFDYKEDYTQWNKAKHTIHVTYELSLTRSDDPALISFIEKFAEKVFECDPIAVVIDQTVTPDDKTKTLVTVGGTKISEQAASEIVRKFKSANTMIIHNSTNAQPEFFFGKGRARAFYDVHFSSEEQKILGEADKHVQRKVKKLAKAHRDELNDMLGRLNEKYDVEFSALEGYSSRRMPLSINLKDKHVEVPLNDWGSGTQNRTYVLMSILQANRIRTRKSAEDKITPIVLVEEPESFLHPSAQAEFGKLLQVLSSELKIQIIVSTHSPYMLNHNEPASNILLKRVVSNKKLLATHAVDTTGEQWMEPFADHLGVASAEFASWHSLFVSKRSKVLLVEGEIDKEYFHYLTEIAGERFGVDKDVDVVSYGGKGALQHSALLKFLLSQLKRVFITFDMDASKDVKTVLGKLGLVEGISYIPIGINKPGRDAIEGLLPECITSAVNGRENDLVMQLGSANSDKRREARDRLKKLYLAEFKKRADYTNDELGEFIKVGQKIKKYFA